MDVDRVAPLEYGADHGHDGVGPLQLQTLATGAAPGPVEGLEHAWAGAPRVRRRREHPHEAVVQGLARDRLGELGVGVYVHPVLDGGHDEVVAGREELVYGAEPDTSPSRHFAKLHCVVAAGLEHLDDHVEDALGRMWLGSGSWKRCFFSDNIISRVLAR